MKKHVVAGLAVSVLLVGCAGGQPGPGAGVAPDVDAYRAAAPTHGGVITDVTELGPGRHAVRTSIPAEDTGAAMALCEEIAGTLDPLPGTFVVRDGGGNIAVTWNHPRHQGVCATA